MNIATIADNCGLLDLDISDAELKKEFQEIFSKYHKKQKIFTFRFTPSLKRYLIQLKKFYR